MSEDKQNHNECNIDFLNDDGETNLCCCYVLDKDGNYETPCYAPVDDCCSG